jgi:hypothetical protein
MPIFGKSDAQDERRRAKSEYESVKELTGDSRNARSARIRAGLRARAHIDKTFIDGAERANAYNDACMIAIADGKDKPPPPKASAYQRIPSVNGQVLTYVPMEFAEEAFKLGARYQLMEITAQQAIELVQGVADRVGYDLGLDETFEALGFLREEIAEAAGETGDTASEGAAGAASASAQPGGASAASPPRK